MLKVNEIFASILGESSFAGLPFVFVRLTGCSLRCSYCDTQYAFEAGEEMPLEDVMQKIRETGLARVLITGGEPLEQAETLPLMKRLCDERYFVMLETNGHQPLEGVDKRVRVIMDIKTPGSKMSRKNRYENLKLLDAQDEIKFVLTGEADYKWAKNAIDKYKLKGKFQILFSPVHGIFDPKKLSELILRDKLDVRLQVQLHKYLKFQ